MHHNKYNKHYNYFKTIENERKIEMNNHDKQQIENLKEFKEKCLTTRNLTTEERVKKFCEAMRGERRNKKRKYFVVVESSYANWIIADNEEEVKKIALENFFKVEPEIYIEDEEE